MITPKKLALIGALILSSCASNMTDPWAGIGAGATTIGTSTGWAFYGAATEAEGTGGVLAGETGTDDTDLTPNYGAALKVNHFITDDFSLGLVYELRNFDADPVAPLSAELTPDAFTTHHFLLSSRYWLKPMGNDGRWKPFVGVDLGYIPEVNFGEVDVNYPGSIPNENVTIVGSSYWTLGLVAGASYMLLEGLSLDMGAFYEFALTPGEDTLVFPNLGNATADVEVWAEGLVLFGGLTWYL